MKKTLLFISVSTLLATTGCFFPGHGDGDRDRDHWHDRGETKTGAWMVEESAPDVSVTHPVVDARAPEIVVAAP